MYWPLIDERGIIPVLVDVKTTLFECSETCLNNIIYSKVGLDAVDVDISHIVHQVAKLLNSLYKTDFNT